MGSLLTLTLCAAMPFGILYSTWRLTRIELSYYMLSPSVMVIGFLLYLLVGFWNTVSLFILFMMMSAVLLVLNDSIASIGNFILRRRQVYQEPLLANGKAKDTQRAETRFASTLPLDRAAETLASMTDDDYDVRLMRLSADKFTFTIQQIGNQYMPQIRGTLHRWNHNETKLDVSRDNFFEMKDADSIINRLIDTLKSEGDVDVLGG